jgi:hypothetical protein
MPPYSGDFQFNTRVYLNQQTQKKGSFSITVLPDTITTCSFGFASSETVTTLYPNSNHFYTISWTTVNTLLSLGGNSYITVTLLSVFTLSSTYCQITTSVSSFDTKGIWCDLSAGGTVINIKNIADAPGGSTFSITVQLISAATTSNVSPQAKILTYYGTGNLVDQVLAVNFATYPLTNTNLTVFSSFSLPTASTSTKAITAGYFGCLLVSFQPESSNTPVNGS